MERISYSDQKIEAIRDKVQQLVGIVSELEADFPGRHFTLDGHLVGSIGEILAAYYYGIDLYTASTEQHDGIVDGRQVQIKITQKDTILISSEPEYLIVLYLTKDGAVYEVYNGRGEAAMKLARKKDNHNNFHLRINKLIEIDLDVLPEDRIAAKHPIAKMKREYKNKKT